MSIKLGNPLHVCRVCKSTNLKKIFSFGPTPLANNFLHETEKDLPELFFPLDVFFCQSCSFLQLGYVVNPKLLFDNYVYVSSTSAVFVNHFVKFSDDVIKKFSLTNASFVVDIGSNDGILLLPYLKKGIKVLGIEPAKHIAEIARKKGITTVAKYFSVKLANRAVKKPEKADIVTATNVFAHINDLDEVINGVKSIIKKDGVFIIEAPYLIDFLEKKYFDLVYHEHLSYWSVRSFITIFKRFDMEVFDVEKVSVHGGSIRVYVKNKNSKYKKSNSVSKFLEKEKRMKLGKIQTYLSFQNEILKIRAKLVSLLKDLKLKGKTIAAYGAPAKGNTLLNYFKIGSEIIEYVVDDSSYKQGLYTPGTRIRVVSSDELNINQPDYILILAWNFKESIIENNSWLKKRSKFIIPLPYPEIL